MKLLKEKEKKNLGRINEAKEVKGMERKKLVREEGTSKKRVKRKRRKGGRDTSVGMQG